MINIAAVFLGGGLGAVLRFIAGLYFPFSTFAVNVVGSFILGFLFAFFADKPEIEKSLKLALTAGFCGGFTTFSTFSFQIFEMLKNGNLINALAYILLSVIIGLLAVGTGVYCAKFI